MKHKERKTLLDATAGIREDYLEDAMYVAPRRMHRWIRYAAAAAALVLLLGLGTWLWPEGKEPATIFPTFAIRAYASNGEEVTMEKTGDSVTVRKESSELFPGKQVYVLDISLEGYEGDHAQLLDGKFILWHRGNHYLKPGESDEELTVQWLTPEKDGMFGYRLIGWCAEADGIGLKIIGEGNRILYQKEIDIQYSNGEYEMDVPIAYAYQTNRSTEELLRVVLMQDYSGHTMLNSSVDHRFLLNHTGFWELIQRPDAPAILLEQFISIQKGNELYPLDSVFGGMRRSNDWLVNIILCWDEVWNGLTPREQALALGHGSNRLLIDSDSDRFGKELGHWMRVTAPSTAEEDSVLEVSYNGITTRVEDDHIRFFPTIGTDENGKEIYGWRVAVWFAESTEVTFTVRSGAGDLLQQDSYRITYVEENGAGHYEVEELTP